MLVNLVEILKIAEEKKCAVGAFNTPNLECVNAVLAAAPKKVVAKPDENGGDSEDEDIFSASMHNEREENASDAEKTLVGGDTASFRPLRIDDSDDEDSEEEEELEYAVKVAEAKVNEQGEKDEK